MRPGRLPAADASLAPILAASSSTPVQEYSKRKKNSHSVPRPEVPTAPVRVCSDKSTRPASVDTPLQSPFPTKWARSAS